MTWPCKNKDYLSICQRQEAEMYWRMPCRVGLMKWMQTSFLLNGLSVAIEDYRKQFNCDSTSEEAIKNENWEIIEYQNLIQQAQSIPAWKQCLLLSTLPFVIILSEEPFQKETNLCIPYPGFHAVWWKRAWKKPYALPVRYTPYRTLKDQYIRDFSREITVNTRV